MSCLVYEVSEPWSWLTCFRGACPRWAARVDLIIWLMLVISDEYWSPPGLTSMPPSTPVIRRPNNRWNNFRLRGWVVYTSLVSGPHFPVYMFTFTSIPRVMSGGKCCLILIQYSAEWKGILMVWQGCRSVVPAAWWMRCIQFDGRMIIVITVIIESIRGSIFQYKCRVRLYNILLGHGTFTASSFITYGNVKFDDSRYRPLVSHDDQSTHAWWWDACAWQFGSGAKPSFSHSDT